VLLQNISVCRVHGKQLWTCCVGRAGNPIIDMGFHPYSFKSIPIPKNAAGYVYILVSCRDKTTTYVGRTMDLVKRLHQHNSGHGSKHTLPEERRPFALIGYVTGFEGSVKTMHAFEQITPSKNFQWALRQSNLSRP
jgi:predicted GIY-YIG superfamily endonuclease